MTEAARAANNKDYTKAAILLKGALRDEPNSQELKAAIASVLNGSAMQETNAGNFSKAADILKETLAYSDDIVYRLNLAAVLTRLNDYTGALAAVEGDSADPAAKPVLKNIYIHLGNASRKANNTAEASAFYEKALALDPTDARLKAAVLPSTAPRANEDSGMTRSDALHFDVKFEGGENAVAGHLIGMLLEEAYVKVGSDLSFYPSDRVEALLYTRESFRDVTQMPSWAGGLYDGRIKIPAGGVAEKTSELEKVIFHEYTHALVQRIARTRVPTWLNEGLAQYEEGKSASARSADLKQMALGGRLRLRDYDGSFLTLSSNDAAKAYLVSLSATEYLIREFGVFSAKKVLEGLGSGATFDTALNSAIYMSYDAFEKSWLDSLKR